MKRRKFVRTVLIGGAGVAAQGLPFKRVYSESPKKQSTVRTNRRHIVRGRPTNSGTVTNSHFRLPRNTETL